MKKGIQLSLKAGERIFINGAVLRVDRKVTVELMNDATFLLESHVLQAENATTPLRQLYFIVQTMLMDPANAGDSREVFKRTINLLMAAFKNEQVLEGLRAVDNYIENGRVFDALKTIRSFYGIEDNILANKISTELKMEKREVA